MRGRESPFRKIPTPAPITFIQKVHIAAFHLAVITRENKHNKRKLSWLDFQRLKTDFSI